MPITYNMPFSQFVDPGSTEISEMLRERFLANYQATSKLEQEMSNLQVAPFEGDKKLKNQLVSNVQSQLSSIADRGDYENMTMPVMSAASTYAKQSAPIQQNAERYRTYVEGLKEAYESGEMGVDYEDYQGAIALSTMNYSGLTQNPDGSYSNPFQGVDLIANPNIQERINEQIKMIAADIVGEEVKSVGMGPNGEFTVHTKNKVEYISPDKILLGIDNVFNDPAVTSYIQRKAEIRNAMMSDEDVTKAHNEHITALSNNLRDTQEELSKTKDKDRRAQLETSIADQIQEIGRLSGISSIDQIRGEVKSAEMSNIINGYRNAALSSSYSKQLENATLVDWDKLWLKNQEGTQLASTSNVQLAGRLFEQISPSGTTFEQMSTSVAEAKQNLMELQTSESLLEAGINPELFSIQDIMTLSDEEIEKRAGVGAVPVIAKRRNLIQNQQNIISATSRAMQEAQSTVGLTNDVMLKQYQSVEGASEMIGAISSELGVSNEEAAGMMMNYFKIAKELESEAAQQNWKDVFSLNVLNGFEGGRIKNMIIQATDKINLSEENYMSPETFDQISKIVGRPNYVSTISPAVALGIRMPFTERNVGDAEFNGIAAEDIFEDLRIIHEKMMVDLNKELKTKTRTQFQGSFQTALPGMTKAEVSDINKLLPSGSRAVTNIPMLNPFTGEEQSFDLLVQDLQERGLLEGFDPQTATQSSSVVFDPYSYSHRGSLAFITMEDESGVAGTFSFPLQRVLNAPSYSRLMGRAAYQFQQKVAAQNAMGVKDIVIPVMLDTNETVNIHVDLQSDTYYIAKFDGTRTEAQDLTSGLADQGPIAQLFEHGARF